MKDQKGTSKESTFGPVVDLAIEFLHLTVRMSSKMSGSSNHNRLGRS